MIPTVTYDQVSLEQEGRPASLEFRWHARAAQARQHESEPTERLQALPASLRAAIVTGSMLVATLVLLIR